MQSRGAQKYTVGFIFNRDFSKVLLVHKETPEWQKGKVNGIGGKYEKGESAEECISRETYEEARLKIPPASWMYVGVLRQSRGDVGILTAKYNGNLDDAVTNDHEAVEWFDIVKLPENVISNVRWLIPLCLDKLQNGFAEFSVQY